MARTLRVRLNISRLGVLAAAVVVGLLLGRVAEHAWVGVAGLLAIGLLGTVWPFFFMALLRVEGIETDSRRVRVGEGVGLRVHLGGWAFSVAALRVPGLKLGEWRGRLGWSSRAFITKGIPSNRGVVDLAEAEIWTSFPFGLMEVSRTVSPVNARASRVIVWPIALPVEIEMLRSPATAAIPAFEPARLGQGEGEFAGVRSYRRGDSMRSIHWRQTARHGRLIVREPGGGSTRRRVSITLDTRRSSYPDKSLFEQAISAAAGAIEATVGAGEPAVLTVGENTWEVESRANLTLVMDELARLSLTDEPLPDKTSVILITSEIGAATGSGLRKLVVDGEGGLRAW